METLYQIFVSQLDSTVDRFLNVLVLDTLVFLTSGFQKAQEVGVLFYDQLKKKFAHEDVNLLHNKAPLAFGLTIASLQNWHTSSDLFIQMMLPPFFQLVPAEKKLLYTASILKAIKDLRRDPSKKVHPTLTILTTDTLSAVSPFCQI